ncbi:MAG: GAF domain-containing protein [Nitrospinota bacterium]|nr:GAF domain-containing protein [Nitrospinota bacterium]
MGANADSAEPCDCHGEADAISRALGRANRALQALSEVNRELIRASDESTFLCTICRTMTQIGGYKMAWIGAMVNDSSRSVIPVAYAGVTGDYLKKIKVTWADEPAGRGPTGTSIRTMRPVINHDTYSEPIFLPWRDEALRHGFASSGAFPIMVDGQCFGALMVYSTEKGAFDQKEIDLLTGLATDAGFGISIIREKAALKKAEIERQGLEEKIRQAQKMESLGLMAGGVAHDFNNLLSVIMLNLDLARDQPSAVASVYIDRARQAARRSSEICRQMLIYAGQGSSVLEPVEMKRLIQDMTSLLRPSFSKKTSLRLDLCDDIWPVMADISQLRQMVMNLVVNAADSLGESGGDITIRTRETQAPLTPGDYYYYAPELAGHKALQLEVEDTGPGLDPQTAAKIFDPFFSTKAAGRGLGLAVVLGIIKGAGGAICACGAKGKGALFRILLPLETSGVCQEQPAAMASAKIPAEKKSVLVIEDEENLRTACQIALAMNGFNVLCAANGREGLDLLSANSKGIGLIILDLSMPVMDGAQTLAELESCGAQVGVILASGYDKSIRTRFEKSRLVVDFLAKPYNADELVRMVCGAMKDDYQRK